MIYLIAPGYRSHLKEVATWPCQSTPPMAGRTTRQRSHLNAYRKPSAAPRKRHTVIATPQRSAMVRATWNTAANRRRSAARKAAALPEHKPHTLSGCGALQFQMFTFGVSGCTICFKQELYGNRHTRFALIASL